MLILQTYDIIQGLAAEEEEAKKVITKRRIRVPCTKAWVVEAPAFFQLADGGGDGQWWRQVR